MAIDVSKFKHHQALEEIVDVLCKLTRTNDRGYYQPMVAYFFGKLAASMRVTVYSKITNEVPVNVYALLLAPSGYSKGKSTGIVERRFLGQFRERYMADTFPIIAEQNLWAIANNRAVRKGTDQQKEFELVEKEYNELGPYIFSGDSGTEAGIRQIRQKILMATIGGVNVEIDEIGLNLSKTREIFEIFLELYDLGLVRTKMLKHSKDAPRSPEIQGSTPTNLMAFGTPSKLFDDDKTEELFLTLMEAGLARRFIFGFGHKKKTDAKPNAKEVYERISDPSTDMLIHQWADHFAQLADPALHGWRVKTPDDVGEALAHYMIECEHVAEQLPEHETIRKPELAHRYFKALKIAAAYAFIDGSTEVTMDHLEAAIKLVEESGTSFTNILSKDANYIKLAKYLASIGMRVTQADLHEALPFFKGGQKTREEMMTMATSWGYTRHIIIKKEFESNIEFFRGETLKQTDLTKMRIAYSTDWAFHYLNEEQPFSQLHTLMKAQDFNWTNHHFKNGHRCNENVIQGFNLICIDVDGGIAIQTAFELMKDYKFLVYTTKSHTDADHRYRMIFPTNYHLDLDPDEYKEFMDGIMDWLPFPRQLVENQQVVQRGMDPGANQIAKKWRTWALGEHAYNDGKLFDVLPFIPKTKANEEHKQRFQEIASLDALERWFAGRMAPGNRNNEMIKYALALVDQGISLHEVRKTVHSFNKKLSDPMTETEIDGTIMVTVAKKFQQAS